ncbi:hypothetical protein FNV43_RR13553 [Rhamnella rubrinervis]|uniref:EB domain-containing protein n=1 Tax=Rhamnella rubrinervis TaxID=2594499 RepID=A0A8K0H1J0_9ROSA|nr:hypothetical protein FNV43_RR13553 [Rhamnella rubrinervis]
MDACLIFMLLLVISAGTGSTEARITISAGQCSRVADCAGIVSCIDKPIVCHNGKCECGPPSKLTEATVTQANQCSRVADCAGIVSCIDKPIVCHNGKCECGPPSKLTEATVTQANQCSRVADCAVIEVEEEVKHGKAMYFAPEDTVLEPDAR